MSTPAQRFVQMTLEGILDGKTPYRVGALVLTYADPEDPGVCGRVVHGVAMSEPITEDHGPGIVHTIRSLRYLADVLDAKIHGRPEPEPPK